LAQAVEPYCFAAPYSADNLAQAPPGSVMFRAAVAFLAVAALLPGIVVGQVEDASEMADLEREFESLAYGGHRGHHQGHHHHFRHHYKSPHPRHHKGAFLAASPATTDRAASPTEAFLPGRHPTVAKKLAHMNQAMRDLKGRQQAAAMARGNLEENVQHAVLHMNEAVGIKRELARTDLQIRTEEIKLKKLEDDRLRLDRTHNHLVSSLHHIMEPKIQFAETRLKQRQNSLRELEAKAAQWKEKENKFHESSLARLEERRETKKKLEAAEEAAKKARIEEETAGKELEVAKHGVAFNVEGYRYAQTRARASASTEERGKQTAREAESSVKRLTGILNMEQRRVDESMAVGKDRVQGKIHELETVKEKTVAKEKKLSHEYEAWQRQQRAWARRVAATKQTTHFASKEYADRQQEVLDSAQAKAAYDAESDTDWAWNEWPGSRKHDVDEVHLDAM